MKNIENNENNEDVVGNQFDKNYQQGGFPGTEFIKRVEIIPNLFLCWSFREENSNIYQINIKPTITFEYYDAINNPNELIELEPEFGPITHFKKFDESVVYDNDDLPEILNHHILGKYNRNDVGWTQLSVDSTGIKKYILDGEYEMVRTILKSFLSKQDD